MNRRSSRATVRSIPQNFSQTPTYGLLASKIQSVVCLHPSRLPQVRREEQERHLREDVHEGQVGDLGGALLGIEAVGHDAQNPDERNVDALGETLLFHSEDQPLQRAPLRK